MGRLALALVSLGFAFYPFFPKDPRLLTWQKVMAVADKALYLSKESGKNAWAGFFSQHETLPADRIEELVDNPEPFREEGVIELRATFLNQPTPV